MMSTTTIVPVLVEPDAYQSPTWMPIDLAIGVIECTSCFICIVFSMHLIKSHGSLSPKFVVLTTSALLLFLISATAITINGYYWNMIYWEILPIHYNSWHIAWLFWSFGQCISYILFIDRLKLAFINTGFEIQRWKRYILHCFLIIYCVIWISSTCLPLITLNTNVTNDDNLKEQEFWHIQYYLTIAITAIDIILTSSITYMFVVRLYKLDEMDKKSKAGSVLTLQSIKTNSITNVSERKTTDGLSEMRMVSIKITILSMTSLLSSFLTVSFRTIAYFYVYNESLQHNEVLYGVFGNAQVIWLQIDTIISCICLILFLPGTKTLYSKLCCGCIAIIARYHKEKEFKKENQIKETNLPKQTSVSEVNMAEIVVTSPTETISNVDYH